MTVNIYRGDKVGIVGPNGSGKSTLLKTLLGELAPIAGKIEIATGVRIGYFDQKLGTLDESLSLVEEIRSVRADLSPEAVRSYLAKFRFYGDDPFKVVRGLSGGERSRLAMAKIMLFPRNVLVLDEPTNHLDIPARETLEDALSEYAGTLIVVSHDRYFLDRVCTRLLVIDGTALETHLGNYSDWRQRVRQSERERPARRRRPGASAAGGVGVGINQRARRRQGARTRATTAGAACGDTGGGCKQAGGGARDRAAGAWRRSRWRLAEAAHAGRSRTTTRRVAGETHRRMGSGQRRHAQPIRNILRGKDLTGGAVDFGVAPCPSHHTLIV